VKSTHILEEHLGSLDPIPQLDTVCPHLNNLLNTFQQRIGENSVGELRKELTRFLQLCERYNKEQDSTRNKKCRLSSLTHLSRVLRHHRHTLSTSLLSPSTPLANSETSLLLYRTLKELCWLCKEERMDEVSRRSVSR